MTEYSTEALPERERFSYWRDVLCAAYVALNPTVASAVPFRGKVSAHLLSGCNVTSISSISQQIHRGRSEIIANPMEVYFLNLQVSGRSRMLQSGREALLNPGQFAIVDSTEPYTVDYLTDDWNQFSFRIPHSLLRPRLKSPPFSTAIAVSNSVGIGMVTIDFLSSLAKNVNALPEHDCRLVCNLVDLISLALDGSGIVADDRKESVRKALRNSILQYIDANLADVEISPVTVAAKFHISTRYLHRLLEECDKTFGRLLLERRLHRCALDLIARREDVSISEIAYNWGFNDLSHFSRTFRQKYGASPKDFRHSAGDADANSLLFASAVKHPTDSHLLR